MNLGGWWSIHPGIFRLLEVRFLCTGAIRMNLYHRAIQRDRVDPDANDLLTLQFSEHTIQHAVARPAIHSRVYRVPSAKTLEQSAPFAAMLSHVKNRTEHLQVCQADVAALSRQAMLIPDARITHHAPIGAHVSKTSLLPRLRSSSLCLRQKLVRLLDLAAGVSGRNAQVARRTSVSGLAANGTELATTPASRHCRLRGDFDARSLRQSRRAANCRWYLHRPDQAARMGIEIPVSRSGCILLEGDRKTACRS